MHCGWEKSQVTGAPRHPTDQRLWPLPSHQHLVGNLGQGKNSSPSSRCTRLHALLTSFDLFPHARARLHTHSTPSFYPPAVRPGSFPLPTFQRESQRRRRRHLPLLTPPRGPLFVNTARRLSLIAKAFWGSPLPAHPTQRSRRRPRATKRQCAETLIKIGEPSQIATPSHIILHPKFSLPIPTRC